MRQAGELTRLAGQARGLVGTRVVQQLDGHRRAQPLVDRAPDVPRAARTEPFLQPVPATHERSRPHRAGWYPLRHDLHSRGAPARQPAVDNAQKVRFLLGELGLDYERREVPFGGTGLPGTGR